MYLIFCVCMRAKMLCVCMCAIILCACVVCMCVNDFRAYMCEKICHVYNNFVCMRGVYVFNDLCEYVCVCVQKCRAHGCVQ